MDLMKPEILMLKITEIMGMRKFKHDTDGLKMRVSNIDELLSRKMPDDKRKAHLGETQQAILDLAQHGYPNEALKYMQSYLAMWKELPNDENLITG